MCRHRATVGCRGYGAYAEARLEVRVYLRTESLPKATHARTQQNNGGRRRLTAPHSNIA